MTIYHLNVWNYDADESALQLAWEIGGPTMQPYIDAGYCSNTEFYWTPSNPVRGGGMYTIRRVWTDYDKLQEWKEIINTVRTDNPAVHDAVGLVETHNDNDYNPPGI